MATQVLVVENLSQVGGVVWSGVVKACGKGAKKDCFNGEMKGEVTSCNLQPQKAKQAA